MASVDRVYHFGNGFSIPWWQRNTFGFKFMRVRGGERSKIETNRFIDVAETFSKWVIQPMLTFKH